MIDKDFRRLFDEFKRISNIRWVKGVNNYTNSVGLTFESLLGKKTDSLIFPDYYGIEIKCSQRFSRFPVSLFSVSFDGSSLFEMNRLLKVYGVKDEKFTDRLQLQGFIYSKRYNKINNNYFKLKVSYEDERIYILIYDLKFNLIDNNAYIEFSTIKNKLELKLSKLAMVYASKKKIDNQLYFRYYLIAFYKLSSFDNFIKLLNDDFIRVSIIGRVSRSGYNIGRQRNKNIVFSVSKDNLEMLFDKCYEYNYDLTNFNS